MKPKKEWHFLFDKLSEKDRKELFSEAKRRTGARPMPFPVVFAVRVSLMTFLLLLIMPTHPITIPAAFGGALSINLLIH